MKNRLVGFAVIAVVAIATAHWWLPPTVKFVHLLAANFDMIRQTVS